MEVNVPIQRMKARDPARAEDHKVQAVTLRRLGQSWEDICKTTGASHRALNRWFHAEDLIGKRIQAARKYRKPRPQQAAPRYPLRLDAPLAGLSKVHGCGEWDDPTADEALQWTTSRHQEVWEWNVAHQTPQYRGL